MVLNKKEFFFFLFLTKKKIIIITVIRIFEVDIIFVYLKMNKLKM